MSPEGVGQGRLVQPLVSVVMPAYNAERTLAASMQSVLAQGHANLELLVVDDCSRDATRAIIEGAAAVDRRVVPLRQPSNAGVAAARNAALEAASGVYVAFLDSDDRWHAGKLEAQLAFMRESGTQVCYASYRRVDGRGKALSIVTPPRRIDYQGMLRSNWIGNLTGIYDRRVGEFRFQRVGHEDYAFWLQVVRQAGEAHRLPDPAAMADYLVRDGSLSADKLAAARWQWHIYRHVERLGRARASWYFVNYAARAAVKRC